MIVSMNVSHFVKICQVLTILHQIISRGVANFGTRCSSIFFIQCVVYMLSVSCLCSILGKSADFFSANCLSEISLYA